LSDLRKKPVRESTTIRPSVAERVAGRRRQQGGAGNRGAVRFKVSNDEAKNYTTAHLLQKVLVQERGKIWVLIPQTHVLTTFISFYDEK